MLAHLKMYNLGVDSYPARALRALGLLVADSALTVQLGGGRLFGAFFMKTAISQEQKVEKSLPTWELNRLSKGYKRVVDQNWGFMAKIGFLAQKTEISGPKKTTS